MNTSPYVHSGTLEEFNYLSEKMKNLGFRGVGNVEIRSDCLFRKAYILTDYDIVRTLGFSSDGKPLQNYNGESGNDFIFFFIRPKDERAVA